MKSSISNLAFALYILNGAQAATAPEHWDVHSDLAVEDPVPGYETFIPSWEVSVTPDGPSIILNGTVEEVYAQLVELNPNYDADFADVPLAPEEKVSARDFNIRFPPDSGYNCFGRWGFVFTDTLWDGIDYLRRIGGKPYSSGGPSHCARVSCSWRTAIYWCNDDRGEKTLDSFGSIADGAQFIYSRCKDLGGAHRDFEISAGQVFHRTSWNVIVRDDNC